MEGKLLVKKKRRNYAVPFDEIMYINSEVRKVMINTDKGVLTVYGKLKDVFPQLDERFMFCHKSYIINMDKIVHFDGGKIVLNDDSVIHMGRDCWRKATKCYYDYKNFI